MCRATPGANERSRGRGTSNAGTSYFQDTALCEAVQQGLRSRGYSQGRFVVNRDKPEWSEHHVHMFQTLVRDAVMGER